MKNNILDWTFREAANMCRDTEECLSCEARRKGRCAFSNLIGILPKEWLVSKETKIYAKQDVEDAKAILRIYPRAIRLCKTEHAIYVEMSDGTVSEALDNSDLIPSLKVGGSIEIKDILGDESKWRKDNC